MKDNFTIYRFSEYILDAAKRTVSRNGASVEIPSKTFDVLLLLAEKSGETVSKEDILNDVWGDSFVEEGNLTVHISKLRKLLGSTKGQPIIKTVTGKGYQFVASVKQSENDSDNDLISPDIHVSQPPIKMLDSDSIAVLPLKNENGDEEIDYLADGLTESLINSLSYMPDVRVIARDTVFRYKNKEIDPREIGEAMDVGTILTGRLRLIKDNLAIGVELVKTRDGTQIWGTQLNQPFTDIFEVQESLTNSITQNLTSEPQQVVTDSLPGEFTQNPESYRLYLKGKYLLDTRTFKNLRSSLDYFHESISSDPSFPFPYIGLAECHFYRHVYERIPSSKTLPLTQKYLNQAQKLNPRIPDIYVVLGNVRLLEWNFADSEACYKKALSLNPSHAEALRYYSQLLSKLGRSSNAFETISNLKRLSPVSTLVDISIGRVFLHSRQYENAAIALSEVLELESHNFVALNILGLIRMELGDYEKAIELILQGLEIQDAIEFKCLLSYIYAKSGNFDKALNMLKELEKESKILHSSKTHFAMVYAVLGEADTAFDLLEEAYKEKDENLVNLKVETRWDPLRNDPRFTDLMERVGLPID